MFNQFTAASRAFTCYAHLDPLGIESVTDVQFDRLSGADIGHLGLQAAVLLDTLLVHVPVSIRSGGLAHLSEILLRRRLSNRGVVAVGGNMLTTAKMGSVS